MSHIVYQNRKYKRIIISIGGDMPSHEIYGKMSHLSIPFIPHADEQHVHYVLLELLYNSLRAHRMNRIKENIRLELGVQAKNLKITIIDRGGGFDISTLPYNQEDPVNDIDLNSEKFQVYREKNQYKRFGMGLILARRLFPDFTINFYNENEQDVSYSSGQVVGTRIDIQYQRARATPRTRL